MWTSQRGAVCFLLVSCCCPAQLVRRHGGIGDEQPTGFAQNRDCLLTVEQRQALIDKLHAASSSAALAIGAWLRSGAGVDQC